MTSLLLPVAGGRVERYALKRTALPRSDDRKTSPVFNRVAYAAAHVVVDPLADTDPHLEASIDWDATLKFRHYLWDLGFGVAEAMDTAQRGMGLDWPGALELIRRALAEAKGRSDRVWRRDGSSAAWGRCNIWRSCFVSRMRLACYGTRSSRRDASVP